MAKNENHRVVYCAMAAWLCLAPVAEAATPPAAWVAPVLPEDATAVERFVVVDGVLVAIGSAGADNNGFIATSSSLLRLDDPLSAAVSGPRRLFAAGSTRASSSAWFSRFTPNMLPKWRAVIPAEVDKIPHGVVSLRGSVFACGAENPLQTGALFGWLARVGDDGSPGWQLSLGGAAYDVFHGCATRGKQILAVGANGPAAKSDAWLVAVTPKGVVSWDVRPDDRGTWTVARVALGDDLGFLVLGETAAAEPLDGRGGAPFLWRVKPDNGVVTALTLTSPPEPVTVTAASLADNGKMWIAAWGASGGWLGERNDAAVRWTALPGFSRLLAVIPEGDGAWIGGTRTDGRARLLRR